MKKILFTTILFIFIASVISSYACTTIIVGDKATNDGSIIIARSNDNDDAAQPQNMTFHPANKENSVFNSNSISNSNANKFSFKMPKNSLSYVSFPHWQSITKPNLSFEETGINEYGIAISATETIFNSEQALKTDPYLLTNGLTEDSITNVILPYAVSAKGGVKILGNMIENFGAGEGFGVAFSDRKEAWYLETASGHHWLAIRIPEDSYFVSANQGRFQQADLNDIMNISSSPGLIEFAKSNKLFDPAKDSFNFFKCYISNTAHDLTYNYPRVKTLLKMYSNYDYEKNDGLYPVFMKPQKKMSVWDVAAGFRNHYNGTSHDPYQNRNPKEPNRPIAVFRTSLSHITQTRPDLPDDIAYIQYISLGMSDLSAFIPFYRGMTNIPKEYQGAKNKADNNSMFWRYRKMQVLVLQDYPRFAPLVHEAIAKFEKEIVIRQAEMERNYLKLYKNNIIAAKKLIQKFTDETVSKQINMLSNLTKKISKDLGKGNMTNEQFTDLVNKTEAIYHFHGA